MRVGLHCSVRNGMVAALEEAALFGCQTLQIFTRAPCHWRTARLTEEEANSFQRRRKELGLSPVLVHTPFLPNLCSLDERVYARTRRALKEDLIICQRLQADALIIHPGAFSLGSSPEAGIRRMIQAVNEALGAHPGPSIYVENMAGGGRRVGSQWSELRLMKDLVHYPERLGFCLDTAHAFGAGHPLSSPEEVQSTLDALEHAVGLSQVRVIHVNDSRAAPGSHLDLHEHLGKGMIGLQTFRALLADRRLKDPALILETPRISREADLENLRLLRSLL